MDYITSEKLAAQVDIRDLEKHTPLMLCAGTPNVTPGTNCCVVTEGLQATSRLHGF